jgi:hypothetical protein
MWLDDSYIDQPAGIFRGHEQYGDRRPATGVIDDAGAVEAVEAAGDSSHRPGARDGREWG